MPPRRPRGGSSRGRPSAHGRGQRGGAAGASRSGSSGRDRASTSTGPGLGGDRLEGRRAVLEALTAGRRRVRQVWMATERDPAPILEAIRVAAARAGVAVSVVTPEDLDARAKTDAPQGVVARADPLPEADVDQLLADPKAFLVALDGVTDPGNLGAVLRSADGAGATGLLLPKRRAVHVTATAAKAAAGAIEHLPIALVSGIPAVLERASRGGVWTVGLDGDGDVDLFKLPVADRPLVLVLGAEGSGLARLTRERCDLVARIPMKGGVDSLNVAAAAALACYEVARARA
ncbi:MAG TPA: 23S rRNA (guanosine(2251)-2'-O)-methyltransferase RlmB [Acidimicrobiia bacterium]|nr:23S rRNA (guanosine(2251)-2'-O)-methyltransferase RlmB [Acidimicrobiia bacterium]